MEGEKAETLTHGRAASVAWPVLAASLCSAVGVLLAAYASPLPVCPGSQWLLSEGKPIECEKPP